MYRLEFEVGRRFFELLRIAYGISQEHVRRASTCVQRLIYMERGDVEFIDGLGYDEAVLLCAYLERNGFRAGRDYGVCRLNSLYGVALKDRCLQAVKPLHRRVRKAGTVCRVASNILTEWRFREGKRMGDVYEAVDWAYRICSARERLFSVRCPRCGGSGVKVRETIREDKYVIHARRICCGSEETVEIPFKENLKKPISQS